MKLQFLPALENDKAFFRDVHHKAYRPVIEAMFGWDEAKQDGFADVDFQTRNPHLILLGAVKCGVVGWIDKPEFIWLGPLFILPEYQGAGIGTQVVNHFIERANHAGIALRLQTLRGNLGAKRLYERLGFRILEATDVHWQMEYRSLS